MGIDGNIIKHSYETSRDTFDVEIKFRNKTTTIRADISQAHHILHQFHEELLKICEEQNIKVDESSKLAEAQADQSCDKDKVLETKKIATSATAENKIEAAASNEKVFEDVDEGFGSCEKDKVLETKKIATSATAENKIEAAASNEKVFEDVDEAFGSCDKDKALEKKKRATDVPTDPAENKTETEIIEVLSLKLVSNNSVKSAPYNFRVLPLDDYNDDRYYYEASPEVFQTPVKRSKLVRSTQRKYLNQPQDTSDSDVIKRIVLEISPKLLHKFLKEIVRSELDSITEVGLSQAYASDTFQPHAMSSMSTIFVRSSDLTIPSTSNSSIIGSESVVPSSYAQGLLPGVMLMSQVNSTNPNSIFQLSNESCSTTSTMSAPGMALQMRPSLIASSTTSSLSCLSNCRMTTLMAPSVMLNEQAIVSGPDPGFAVTGANSYLNHFLTRIFSIDIMRSSEQSTLDYLTKVVTQMELLKSALGNKEDGTDVLQLLILARQHIEDHSDP